MTDADRLTLVLRYADIGIATYASLRIVGQPSRTVTWVLEEPLLLAALQELTDALPEPHGTESRRDAIERALTTGPFAAPGTELTVAYILGVLLIGAPGWQLLQECVSSPRAALFVAPSARLARVPWGLLAVPKSGPSKEELVRARQEAITASGRVAARIPWQLADIGQHTDGHRLIELVDVLMAVPPNIVHSPRAPAGWDARRDHPPLLVLDPAGARAAPGLRTRIGAGPARAGDAPGAALHRVAANAARRCRPSTRRSNCSAARMPTAPGWPSCWPRARAGCSTSATRVRRPATARTSAAPIGPRCTWPTSGGARRRRRDRRPPPADRVGPDGLAVTDATAGCAAGVRIRWRLPVRRGHRSGGRDDPGRRAVGDRHAVVAAHHRGVSAIHGARREPSDPMADVVAAVDRAHDTADEAGCAVNRWQREQLRRWRDGDATASPLYWAALVTFAVDGAR